MTTDYKTAWEIARANSQDLAAIVEQLEAVCRYLHGELEALNRGDARVPGESWQTEEKKPSYLCNSCGALNFWNTKTECYKCGESWQTEDE